MFWLSKSLGFSRASPSTRVFRTLALFLVASQVFLYAREVSQYPLFAVLFVGFSAIGVFAGLSRFKLSWVFAAAVAIPLVVRVSIFVMIGAKALIFPGPATDAWYALFDETFLPFFPLWLWAIFFAASTERTRWAIPIESALILFILVAATWTQVPGAMTLYPHPSLLAAGAVAAALLVLGSLQSTRSRVEHTWSARTVTGSIAFLILLLTALALIFSLHSERSVAQGGGLMKPTLFRFDFSQFLKLESQISLGDDLVLVVRKDEADRNVFLRRFVLARYDKKSRQFIADRSVESDVPTQLPTRPKIYDGNPWEGRTQLTQEYYLLQLDQGTFVAMNRPTFVTPLRLWKSASFSSMYRVESSVPMAESAFVVARYEAGSSDGALRDSERQACLDYGADLRVRNLAESIVADAKTYYDKVVAIENYLRDTYRYSLNPGIAPDGDQLGYFLFTSKKGYCSYFAFSMTLLLRSLGIPTRIAVGFFVDPDTEALGFYPVKASMAHAWVEVWFGQYGWIEFDPTSRILAEGELMELSNAVDMSVFEKLLREILRNKLVVDDVHDLRAMDDDESFDVVEAVVEFARARWPILMVAAYVLLWLTGRVARAIQFRYASGRRRARLAWAAFLDACNAAGFRRGREESSAEFARRMGEVFSFPADDLAFDFERATFGPEWRAEDSQRFDRAMRTAVTTVQRATTRLRAALALIDPLRAFRRWP